MGPRKFKEMLDQIPRLTPVQKQRLMHGARHRSGATNCLNPFVNGKRSWTDCEYVRRIAVPQGRCVTGSRQACVDFVAVRHRADEPFTR